jgi:zona occludens toxin
MITIYTGTPGSGKSLHLAKNIYQWLRSGINIIANFEINLDKVKHSKGKFTFIETEKITVKYLKQYAIKNHDFKSKKEFQTMIIIDECSDIFNCRDFSRKDRPEWLIFFRQHRKFRYDILLTTQDDREVDRQIRNKIEEEVQHRKMNNFGVIGLLLTLFTFKKFKLFVALTFWKGNKIRTFIEYFIYHKKHGELYDTFKIFSDDEFKALLREGEAIAGDPPRQDIKTDKKEVVKIEKDNCVDFDINDRLYRYVSSSRKTS